MIKSFNSYNYKPLYEAEESEKNNSVKSVESLMGLFFKCYSIAATKVENYSETAADLIAISKAEENEDKGKLLSSTINKVTDKMKDEFKDLSGDLKQASKDIESLYLSIIGSDEGKKSIKDIKTASDKVITDSLQNLKNTVKEIKESSVADYRTYRYRMILEAEENELDGKNKSARQEILNAIKSAQPELMRQSNSGLTDALKKYGSDGVAELEKITKTLKDDKEWGSLKRRARKDKIEEYSNKIAELQKGINDLISSEAIKAGVDKKTAESLKGIADTLSKISSKEAEIKIAKAKKEEESKKSEAVEYKVGDLVKYKRENGDEATSKIEKVEGDKYFFKDAEGKEFSKDKKDIIGKGEEPKKEEGNIEAIESGNVDKENLKKDGKNAEAIKEFQLNYNKSGYFGKISEDGRYGKNTEAAIRKIAGLSKQMANKEINTDGGKKLTKEIIDLAKKLAEGK